MGNGWICMKAQPPKVEPGMSLLISAHRDGRAISGEAEWHEDICGGGWWWANTYGDHFADELVRSGWIITHWQLMPSPVAPEVERDGEQHG